MVKADRLIARQISLEVFSSRKDKPGVYYNEATDVVTAGQFCGIQLTASNKEIEIHRKQTYHALFGSMTAETDKHFRAAVSFIRKEQYQEVFAADHDEVKLRALCAMFNFHLQAFRDYKDRKVDTKTNMFQKLIIAVATVMFQLAPRLARRTSAK